MNYDDLIRYLRGQGHRLTPQRRLTLEMLQRSRRHLSADDIAQQIAVCYPGISIDLATIYRTLKWLRDTGLVAETSLGQGRMVYVLLCHHDHHHLVCEQCGATIEAEPTIFDAVRAELQACYGFAARLEHLSIFGICALCRQAAAAQRAPHSEMSREERMDDQ